MAEPLPQLLPDEANRLRTTWKKASDYIAAFATLWFQLQEDFAKGIYEERRNELAATNRLDPKVPMFGMWCAEIGFSVDFTNKHLKNHFHTLAAEHNEKREASERAERQRKRDEAAAKRAADTQARAEQQAIKAAKKAKDEAETKRKLLAEAKRAASHPAAAPLSRARKGEPQSPAEAALRQSVKGGKWTHARTITQRKTREGKLAALVQSPPKDKICAGLLQECGQIESEHTSRRVALGERYWKIRERVQNGQVGNDETGRPWTWTHWQHVYIIDNPDPLIHQSERTIKRCIHDYENHTEDLLDGSKWPNQQTETVVHLHTTVN